MEYNLDSLSKNFPVKIKKAGKTLDFFLQEDFDFSKEFFVGPMFKKHKKYTLAQFLCTHYFDLFEGYNENFYENFFLNILKKSNINKQDELGNSCFMNFLMNLNTDSVVGNSVWEFFFLNHDFKLNNHFGNDAVSLFFSRRTFLNSKEFLLLINHDILNVFYQDHLNLAKYLILNRKKIPEFLMNLEPFLEKINHEEVYFLLFHLQKEDSLYLQQVFKSLEKIFEDLSFLSKLKNQDVEFSQNLIPLLENSLSLKNFSFIKNFCNRDEKLKSLNTDKSKKLENSTLSSNIETTNSYQHSKIKSLTAIDLIDLIEDSEFPQKQLLKELLTYLLEAQKYEILNESQNQNFSYIFNNLQKILRAIEVNKNEPKLKTLWLSNLKDSVQYFEQLKQESLTYQSIQTKIFKENLDNFYKI